MAQAAKKDKIYVALDSAVSEEFVVVKGKRYPGNHPMVKLAPDLFEETDSAFSDEELAIANRA